MKYFLELKFNNEVNCKECLLSKNKIVNLAGESKKVCQALYNNPKCHDDGYREDCPLRKNI